TIIDTNANGADSADEVLAETWSDGAGRVRLSRVPHTFSGGSTATWAGTITEYDILGRVKRQSVPTEVNSSWEATGDDATRGFIWNSQEYDWKGRTTRTIPSDSTGSDGKDTLITYEGCGCAGGQVVAVQGPVIKQSYGIGQTETTLGRRKQRVESDILGRQTKAILYEWNGSTVYSTITNSYNGRDQIIGRRHYQGTASSGTFQEAVSTFDGHGRLKTRHIPEQNANTNTEFDYFPDGSLKQATDARGAETNYVYNSRGLPSQISYGAPTGITIPATTSFEYDNAGNRTQMTDGFGTVAYAYNSLSQMTVETRQFNSSQPTALQSRTFALSYTYQLSGALKSITDPYEDTINYAYDKVGRTASVTGSAFGTSNSIDEYLTNVSYRAWGAVKQADFGDHGTRMQQTFESGSLRLATFNVSNVTNNVSIFRKDYYYYTDGQARFIRQNYNGVYDNAFDRYYEYDFAGRMTKAFTGDQARTGTQDSQQDDYRPYVQNLTYDVWNNVTSRDAMRWTDDLDLTNSFDEQTNREDTWDYDADGRVKLVPPTSNHEDKFYTYKFDAGGRLVENDSYIVDQAQYPVRNS
ncbi:MAG: hypothetical protein ACRD6X_21660, partial [Pyrinomonadaceae bacterium]